MNEIFANLYELWGVFYIETENFSDQLYNYNIYTPIGWVLMISCVVWMLLYYKLIDHVNFARWFHWLMWLVFLCLINFGFAYYWSTTELDFYFDGDAPYSGEYVNFSLVNVLYAAVFGIFLSLIFKRFAINTKTTPF
jgi:hypothetical protein